MGCQAQAYLFLIICKKNHHSAGVLDIQQTMQGFSWILNLRKTSLDPFQILEYLSLTLDTALSRIFLLQDKLLHHLHPGCGKLIGRVFQSLMPRSRGMDSSSRSVLCPFPQVGDIGCRHSGIQIQQQPQQVCFRSRDPQAFTVDDDGSEIHLAETRPFYSPRFSLTCSVGLKFLKSFRPSGSMVIVPSSNDWF